ncbi:MAG: EcsC family protein [Actinomycetota bacterium]|nr:EcsC family protein [Actinomycetota bacterium]
MGVRSSAARALIPIGLKVAPQLTSSYVREVLERAIDGAGPIRGAAAAAEAKLRAANGDVDAAVGDLIESHVRMAGVEGFVTNIGGLVTLAVSIPANITGLTLLQCHLVAGIASLRGYDLADARVRNAVLACLLGEDTVRGLLKNKRLPSTPMALATSPVHDPELDRRIASEVTTEMVAKIAGRHAVLVVGRRIPVLGGGVGALTDGYSTWQIGRYARAEFRDRRRPVPPG